MPKPRKRPDHEAWATKEQTLRKQKQTERNYDIINQDIWSEAWVRTQKQKIVHVNMKPYTSNPFKYTWGFTMVKSSSKNKSAGTDRMSGVPFTESVSDSRNILYWNNSLINFNVNEECALNTLESHGYLKTLENLPNSNFAHCRKGALLKWLF